MSMTPTQPAPLDDAGAMAVLDKKYRPGSGTEGADFMCAWCFECERDKDESCEILAATMRYAADDPKYPAEWTFDDAGLPQCSAFVPLGDPLPTQRCTATPDMFEAPNG